MKTKICLPIFLCSLFSLSTLKAYCEISLVKNGKTNYSIIISSKAGLGIVKAANELHKYIADISGADIPVKNDESPVTDYEIILGSNVHNEKLGFKTDTSRLGADGFIVQTEKKYLSINATTDKAILYGTYHFIETYLGCRMYSSSVIFIPTNANIVLNNIKDRQIPSFQYRDLYYADAYNTTYTNWHKIDHFDTYDSIENSSRLWGEIWSSSFMYVIPSKDYFEKNPQFFALVNNKRSPDQLCLTDEGMLKEYVKNFRKLMKRFPESKIWSVAANDNLQGNCSCANCQAINQKAGSPMGTLLTFVNKIADSFPNITIATQAYLRYEEPPIDIIPHKNVMIVECGAYYTNRSEPYVTSTTPEAKTFRARLDKWISITPNIRIWDYVIDYPYLMCPFPNFHVLQPNLQFFRDKKIQNVFEQGNIAKGGDFPELRAYLLAKLMWNPDINVDEVMNDFLSGYYGKAGKYMRQYIDLMTSSLITSKIPLISQYHPHKHFKGFLAPQMLQQYNVIFDKAEDAVKDNPDVLERVKVARLPLIYAMLEISKMVQLNQKGSTANLAVGFTADGKILDLLDYFSTMCAKHGIVKLAEYPTTVESFKAEFSKYVNNHFK